MASEMTVTRITLQLGASMFGLRVRQVIRTMKCVATLSRQPFRKLKRLRLLVRMSDNATTQDDKLDLAHVIFGVIGPPGANNKVPFAIRGQNMIDGWKERKTGFVGGPA